MIEIFKPNKYLAVRKNSNYTYSERLGIDSVGFLLIDNTKEKKFGLIEEVKPPLENRYYKEKSVKESCIHRNDYIFLETAFGGSNDTIELHEYFKMDEQNRIKHFKKIVKIEVLEEAGYKVQSKDIKFISKEFVSTQQNQFCYLFVVNVTGKKLGKPTTTDKGEVLSKTKWKNLKEVIKTKCWKAKIIAFNYFIPKDKNVF